MSDRFLITRTALVAKDIAVHFSDNTIGNVSILMHGFCPKGANTGTKFLRDDCGYATPDHTALANIDSASYTHLTSTQATDLTDAGDSILHYHAADRDSANFTGTNWTDLTDAGATALHKHDHGGQDGLTDDDHTQYVLLVGRAGGQTLRGGTAASETLTLVSTNNGTKGKILFGTSAYDEVSNLLGIGITSPTAVLHLKAGTATASTAPLKFTTGISLTAAEAGAMEFTTDDLFFTITTGAARKGIILNDGSNLTSGKIPIASTNGRLIDVTAGAHIIDADGSLADITTKFNTLLAELEVLKLVAAA